MYSKRLASLILNKHTIPFIYLIFNYLIRYLILAHNMLLSLISIISKPNAHFYHFYRPDSHDTGKNLSRPRSTFVTPLVA